MENEKPIEVALVKEACIICGKEIDGPIIMNTKLTKKAAEEVKNLNGKVIDFAEEPCNECKKIMKQGIVLIGYDEEKSDLTNLPYGFYRTGQVLVAKKDSNLIKYFEEQHPNISEKGYIFIPQTIINNLISENNEGTE
jgi:hypothetical protein